MIQISISMKKYHKLVRDKIPEIIKADGEVPVYRILNDEEFRKELLIKVVEEAKELSATGSKGEEMIKEVGDVEEVIESIIKSFNLNKKN